MLPRPRTPRRRRLIAAVLLVAGVVTAAPSVGATDVRGESGPAVVGAVGSVLEARAALDAANAELAGAASRVDAAVQAEAEIVGEINDVDATAAALSPKQKAAVQADVVAAGKLREAAVLVYTNGGMRIPTRSSFGTRVDEAIATRQYARSATERVNDLAKEATRARNAIDGRTAELATKRKELDVRLGSARDELTAATAMADAATAKRDTAADRLRAAEAAAVSGGVGGGYDVAGTDIPQRVMDAYVAAADRLAVEQPGCRIRWWALAGIGRVESGHARSGGAVVDADGKVTPPILGPHLTGGRFAAISDTDDGRYDNDPDWDRAVGPMQFIPSTWNGYVGNGVEDPNDIDDAALAAARYLCRGRGANPLDTTAGIRSAAYSYNHSTRYVDNVVSGALRYAASGYTGQRVIFSGVALPDGVAPAGAVDAAERSIRDVAGAAIGAAGSIGDGTTVVLVAHRGDDVATVSAAAEAAADGLLGRRVWVLTWTPETAEAARAALVGHPGSGASAVSSESLAAAINTAP